jgi:hypothetical protein
VVIAEITFDNVLGVAGVALALLALFQIRRVKTAVGKERRRYSEAVLAARAEDFERTEGAMRSATTIPEAEAAVKDWRRYGREAAELVTPLSHAGDLSEALELSLGVVDTTLSELRVQGVTVQAALDPLLRHVSATCGATRALAAGMMMKGSS